MNHIYIVMTIVFTVVGQILLKHGVNQLGDLPGDWASAFKFLLLAVFDPWVFGGLLCAFLGALSWIAAMTKFQLSYAYPFMAITFALTPILGFFMLHEQITTAKISGIILIVLAVILISR